MTKQANQPQAPKTSGITAIINHPDRDNAKAKLMKVLRTKRFESASGRALRMLFDAASISGPIALEAYKELRAAGLVTERWTMLAGYTAIVGTTPHQKVCVSDSSAPAGIASLDLTDLADDSDEFDEAATSAPNDDGNFDEHMSDIEFDDSDEAELDPSDEPAPANEYPAANEHPRTDHRQAPSMVARHRALLQWLFDAGGKASGAAITGVAIGRRLGVSQAVAAKDVVQLAAEGYIERLMYPGGRKTIQLMLREPGYTTLGQVPSPARVSEPIESVPLPAGAASTGASTPPPPLHVVRDGSDQLSPQQIMAWYERVRREQGAGATRSLANFVSACRYANKSARQYYLDKLAQGLAELDQPVSPAATA
jgi:hypothetical protein